MSRTWSLGQIGHKWSNRGRPLIIWGCGENRKKLIWKVSREKIETEDSPRKARREKKIDVAKIVTTPCRAPDD